MSIYSWVQTKQLEHIENDYSSWNMNIFEHSDICKVSSKLHFEHICELKVGIFKDDKHSQNVWVVLNISMSIVKYALFSIDWLYITQFNRFQRYLRTFFGFLFVLFFFSIPMKWYCKYDKNNDNRNRSEIPLIYTN